MTNIEHRRKVAAQTAAGWRRKQLPWLPGCAELSHPSSDFRDGHQLRIIVSNGGCWHLRSRCFGWILRQSQSDLIMDETKAGRSVVAVPAKHHSHDPPTIEASSRSKHRVNRGPRCVDFGAAVEPDDAGSSKSIW